MLELDSVVKLFGTTVAINGVELSVRDHEYLVILGPAGAGKSTTLRLIAGFVEPIVKELPLEYSIEMNRLIEIQMEGSVG